MERLPTGEMAARCNALDHRAGVALAAACCEYMLPNYAAFQAIEKWGRVHPIRSGLDSAWRFALGESLPARALTVLTGKIEAVTPDSEEFPSLYGSLGFYAAFSVVLTLEMCDAFEVRKLCEVLRNVYDSLELYLTVVNDPDVETHAHSGEVEEWVWHSPLMLRGHETIMNWLEIAESRPAPDGGDTVTRLKDASERSGMYLKERGLFSAMRIRD